ncbi:MAG: AAA family ATPase [Methanoregula sp.]|jgi:replication factor C small subunit|nr:AAA family ATPase [Methanoregula sp.]
MFWIEKYRPNALNDIVGQDAVIRHLSSFAESRTCPHLILSGPHGTGKSVAIECFAQELYGENWELNTTIFQTADLFLQGKALLEQDERYVHLFQKNMSLINNFKHIIKWYASLKPLNAEYKLMVFEDAHTLTRDAQQGLRRIMERTSGTCRFIFSTTNPSALLPAIRSRCLPLFFAPVGTDAILDRLHAIREAEQSSPHSCPDDDLELIVQASAGDLRRAVLLLQGAMETGRCTDLFEISQSETATVAAGALASLRSGDSRSAIRRFEALMIDYGLSGSEVLAEIRSATKREFNHPALAIALADAEFRMLHANNEYIQIGALTAGIREVFSS